MGYEIAGNVRKSSDHKGTAYFVLKELALAADEYDRTATLYMDTLAAYCHMEIRMLQRVLRHLESSGELIVYTSPKTRQACIFQIRVLPVEWPESYRVYRELIDRRRRPIWTDDLEKQRQEIHRHNAALIRKQRAERREARKARQG